MAERILWVGKYLQKSRFGAASILLALLVVCFWPFVAGNKTLLESSGEASSIMPYGAWAGRQASLPMLYSRTKDTGAPAWQIEALLELIKREYLQEKTLPIWNPYQAYGTPLAANMHSQVYEPVTVALALKHSPRIYNWYILFRLFVAGICAYYYMRLFVSFLPALAAGITSMFAGYFLLFITMPHLSVEVLLPAALLSAEHLMRTPRFRSVAWFALVIFLVLTGGMPESSFLLLAVTYLYMLFRALTDSALQSGLLRRIGYLSIATCFGFGFSAILLWPFRQYMRYSFDVHQSANTGSVLGLGYDTLGPTIFEYVFPFFLGANWDNYLRNYAGLISLFLFIVAFLSLSRRRENGNRTLNFLTCFFGFLVIAIVLKRYGFAPVNLVGRLPIFNLVQYPKYDEALLSIFVSFLCAIGIERLVKYQVRAVKQVIALTLTFLVIPLALFAARKEFVSVLASNETNSKIAGWSILLPAGLLTILALLLIVLNSKQLLDRWGDKNARLCLAISMLAILACESLFNYIVPTYYVWNSLPTDASNPYAGAPFIDRLKLIAGHDRIFAEDSLLFPDWSSAFGLFDIRNLDAMSYHKYLPFLQQFFPSRRRQGGDETYDRFTGVGDYHFDDFLQRRMLQMSSVKYVVTMPATTLESNITADILYQNSGRLTPGREKQIASTTLAIGGLTRAVMVEHPPYERLPYHFKVEKGKETLHFSYGVNPAVFPICEGVKEVRRGAEFVIEVRDASGAIKKVFASNVDWRHDLSLRRWIDGSVDLSPYLGQDIDVLLTTDGDPRADICADWVVWSNFHFDYPAPADPFKLIYRDEVKIYEFQQALPRASIYYHAMVKENELEVLKSIGSASWDPAQTMLLNGSALDDQQAGWVKKLNKSPNALSEKANIVSYASQIVTVEAALNRPGILVLNDSDFPGWIVEVDGKQAKFVSANYLFRGVLLEPGKHLIRFAYKPRAVQLGAAVSVASIISFALWGFTRIRRRRRTSGGKPAHVNL